MNRMLIKIIEVDWREYRDDIISSAVSSSCIATSARSVKEEIFFFHVPSPSHVLLRAGVDHYQFDL